MEKEILVGDVQSDGSSVRITISAVFDEERKLSYYAARMDGREIVQVIKSNSGEWCHVGRPPDELSAAIGKLIEENFYE